MKKKNILQIKKKKINNNDLLSSYNVPFAKRKAYFTNNLIIMNPSSLRPIKGRPSEIGAHLKAMPLESDRPFDTYSEEVELGQHLGLEDKSVLLTPVSQSPDGEQTNAKGSNLLRGNGYLPSLELNNLDSSSK
jgi:hypothetical protein